MKDDKPDSHPELFALPLGGGVLTFVDFFIPLVLPLSLTGPLIFEASGGESEAAVSAVVPAADVLG